MSAVEGASAAILAIAASGGERLRRRRRAISMVSLGALIAHPLHRASAVPLPRFAGEDGCAVAANGWAPYPPIDRIAFKIASGVQGASSLGWPSGATAWTASRIAE